MDIEAEITRRAKIALEAIKAMHGTEDGEFSVTLFVEHHLEELSEDDWKDITGSAQPSATQILGCLVLRSHWSEEDDDGIDVFDFTLPKDVTDYVISVSFSETGDVLEIDMES